MLRASGSCKPGRWPAAPGTAAPCHAQAGARNQTRRRLHCEASSRRRDATRRAPRSPALKRSSSARDFGHRRSRRHRAAPHVTQLPRNADCTTRRRPRSRCRCSGGCVDMRVASGRTPTPPIQFTRAQESRRRSGSAGAGKSPRACRPARFALVHHGDAVGHRQRLFLIVRDEQERDADAPLQLFNSRAHLLAQLGIERRQRLVEQQHVRLQHQRPRQCHALPLAARKLRRDSAIPCPSICTSSSTSRTRWSIWFVGAAAAARTRCSAAPSGAGTARSSEIPC